MEASLPSWLSKIAPAGAKGSAMGIYSTMQFSGAFVGGILGGYVMKEYGVEGLFVGLALIVVGWTLLVAVTPKPAHLNSVRIDLAEASTQHNQGYLDVLLAMSGVSDAIFIAEEQAIYLKVDASVFDYQQALARIQSVGD